MLVRKNIRPSLEVALITVNASLYAAFGYLTYLGIFAPVFGTVRFWPAVIIPAVFSMLFSPKIGGVGASLGIFISDLLIHGNPLLSLAVGVPANFAAFYLMGWLAHRWKEESQAIVAVPIQLIPVFGSAAIYYWNLVDQLTAVIFLGTSIVVLIFTAILLFVQRRFLRIAAASSIGLMVGSAIIGVGLWAFSQFFVLPIGGVKNAPLIAALVWFLFTYITEIPFLQFLLPPIFGAIARAVPARPGIAVEGRARG